MNARVSRWRTAVRWIGLPILAVCLWRVDLRALGARLTHLDPRFVVLFLALSVPFYVLCAWRWHFTAARLGASLPFRQAWFDYYLSTLLNQVLPFGVAGDVVRAARHRDRLVHPRPSEPSEPSEPGEGADGPAAWGTSAGAVVLERFSGFVALSLFVLASGVFWFVRERRASFAVGGGFLLGVGLLAVLGVRLAARSSLHARITRAVERARGALLERGALRFHLLVSVAAVGFLLAMFACAGRAAGIAMSPFAVVQVVPLVLAATTFPWAFAGLGPREVATGSLFALMGLTAADGVAVSMTFGVLSFVASAPGVVVLLSRRARA